MHGAEVQVFLRAAGHGHGVSKLHPDLPINGILLLRRKFGILLPKARDRYAFICNYNGALTGEISDNMIGYLGNLTHS